MLGAALFSMVISLTMTHKNFSVSCVIPRCSKTLAPDLPHLLVPREKWHTVMCINDLTTPLHTPITLAQVLLLPVLLQIWNNETCLKNTYKSGRSPPSFRLQPITVWKRGERYKMWVCLSISIAFLSPVFQAQRHLKRGDVGFVLYVHSFIVINYVFDTFL